MNNSESKIAINPWLIAAAVILPTFIEVLDSTIVSVSLPHVAGNLSASVSEATWVQTSYLISNAVILPASGWFSSFFGRKRFFLTCIALFTLASALCGAASSLGFLVFARILQGAGGGALQPLSQAILLESFPPKKHGEAMAVFALGVLVAPVLGPVLGGWVTDNYSWRWVFYVNVPIGAAAIWLVNRFVWDPDYIKNSKPGRIDVVGFALMTLWLGTMQTILDKGQEDDWFSASWIRWFAVISAMALAGFLIRELWTREPIVNLRVFKNRNFAVGTVLFFIFGVVAYSPITLQPLFLQDLLGYSALQSGFAQSPRGLGMLLMMPAVGFLTGKVDARKLIFAGLMVSGATALMLSHINLGIAESNIAWPNFLQGAGLALTTVPLITTALGMLLKDEMGNATGIFNLARNLGGSIGISMVTTMVSRGSQAHQAALFTHLTPYDPAFQNAVQHTQAAFAGQVGAAQAPAMAQGAIYSSLLQQSSLLAYIDDFRWLGLLCFAAIPAVIFFKRVTSTEPIVVH